MSSSAGTPEGILSAHTLSITSKVVNKATIIVPLTGETVSFSSPVLVLNPAGTLASLMLYFPKAETGQVVTLISSQEVTSLTVGVTVVPALTSLAADDAFSYMYCAETDKWYKV
jgi:hypothetical protein